MLRNYGYPFMKQLHITLYVVVTEKSPSLYGSYQPITDYSVLHCIIDG